MHLSIKQYAIACNLSVQTVYNRISQGLIVTEELFGAKVIDTEKFPPAGKSKCGAKKGNQNASKTKKTQ